MAEENSAQEPGQEQEQIQEAEPVQEPAEDQGEKKPAKKEKKKDGGGLLMPILYALLAAVGAFTLVMIIGIVITFLTRPAQPSQTPSEEPPAQGDQVSDQAWRSPDGEGFHPDAAPKGVTALSAEIQSGEKLFPADTPPAAAGVRSGSA